MSISRVFGIILFFIGILCLWMGFNATQAPLDQITETVTGRLTKQTTIYIIGGIIMFFVGGALFLRGRPRP